MCLYCQWNCTTIVLYSVLAYIIEEVTSFSKAKYIFVLYYWNIWFCRVLLYIVLSCIVLYCIVLHCIVLYCIVLYCIGLYWIGLYWIVLNCIVLCCTVLYCIVPAPAPAIFSIFSCFDVSSAGISSSFNVPTSARTHILPQWGNGRGCKYVGLAIRMCAWLYISVSGYTYVCECVSVAFKTMNLSKCCAGVWVLMLF